MKKIRLLFVGPMLGKHTGRVPNPAEELVRYLMPDKYCCRITSTHTNRYIRLFDILFTVFRERTRTDIVVLQVYSGLSFIVEDIASWMVKRLGLKLVMVLHGGAIPEFLARYPNWVLRVLRRADQLVSPSQFIARSLRSFNLCIVVIPNGMDINHYQFHLRSGSSQRLIWLRAFHMIYQPEMAVKVLQRLVGEFPDIFMQMIGPAYGDTSLNNTEKMVVDLNLETHIEIVGYVPKPDLPAYLHKNDIFLNTTCYESFGITVMEAAACGLPIITTNVGELNFLWKNEKNSLTVDVGDVYGMADSVRKLLTDASLCERLSIAARQTAEQFDWSVILPHWEKLFLELDNKGKP